MYDVMAVAGAVWSCPYAWKGPALVTLGREINENKRLRERIGVAERGFVTLTMTPWGLWLWLWPLHAFPRATMNTLCDRCCTFCTGRHLQGPSK